MLHVNYIYTADRTDAIFILHFYCGYYGIHGSLYASTAGRTDSAGTTLVSRMIRTLRILQMHRTPQSARSPESGGPR